MTTQQIARLRLRLPPLADIEGHAIAAAWQSTSGEWQTARVAGLAAVASRFPARRVEICPHPADISMTDIEVPPLRANAQRQAVYGAVELLALTPPEQLIIGFGERHPGGTLPVAWLAAAHLQRIQALLAEAGLRIDALLPPPAFLPQPAEGEASVSTVDNWLVLRSGPASGALLPFPAQAVQPESRLQLLFPAIARFHWATEDEQGEDWHWSLPLHRPRQDNGAPDWLRPAACWIAVAAVVWLGGLNLYAARLQAEGQALKQQMAEQVQAAFPDVSVVLNPLQQARQLRDARLGSATPESSADFPTLLRLTSRLLTNSDGQVARVNYQPGQLDILWREGAALRRAEVEALQQQARAQQLLVVSDAQGIHLRAGQEQTPPAQGNPP